MTANKKVLLIYPPGELYNREDRCQVPSKNVTIAPPLPPTDLMYMAAVAQDANCICKIVDYSIDNKTINDLIKDLNDFKPDYLIMSISSPTLANDLSLCQKIKTILPDIIIIAKGAHFLKFNKEILKEFPSLDIAIRGETEITIKDILSGMDLADIQGITYNSNNEIFTTPDREFLDNLDILPFPARNLIDNNRYIRPDNGKVQGIIKVSRGCPFNCFFCLATPVSGAKVRMRSAKNILAEIRHCIETYNIQNFLLWSDIFNINRDWVVELCNEIIDSKLNFIWATNTRVDTIDLELAKLMRKAGCTLVSVGVESGNQEILNKIGKKITLRQIENTFKILKQAKLKTFAYYLIGLPWDTEESINDTINFSIKLDSDFANFFVATPFPGSQFFDYAIKNNLISNQNSLDDFSTAYFYPLINGHYLDKKKIFELQQSAIKKFVLRPSYIFKRVISIRSFAEFINYFRAGMSILK